MASSDSNQIPTVLRLVSELRPQSILDLGIGRGRYGALFRLTLEPDSVAVSDRTKWALRIDGVEGFAPYVGAIQEAIYDRIVVSSIADAVPKLDQYDVILLGDVIEHFERKEGEALLQALLERARKRVIVVTPNGPYDQDASDGNEYQRHRSVWFPADFLQYPNAEIYVSSKTIVAAVSREPVRLTGRRWKLGERPLRRYPHSSRFTEWLKYRSQSLRKRFSR
jgi:hypothetical protein